MNLHSGLGAASIILFIIATLLPDNPAYNRIVSAGLACLAAAILL